MEKATELLFAKKKIQEMIQDKKEVDEVREQSQKEISEIKKKKAKEVKVFKERLVKLAE